MLRFGIRVPRLQLRDDQFARQSLQIAQGKRNRRSPVVLHRVQCRGHLPPQAALSLGRNHIPDHESNHQQNCQGAPPADRMDAPGLAQHRLLNRRAVLRRHEPHRGQILPPRRQMPVLGLRLPQGSPFRQPQLGPSAARFPLLARQPVPQGVDEVVVCELIVLSARQGRQAVARGTFRVGGRDQAKLGVEDMDQIIEVLGTVCITRGFEQFLT